MYPRVHDVSFGFGLGAEDATKASTILPIIMHDNALVDFETIKTNPENVDFAVYPHPNCCAGSTVLGFSLVIQAYITEVNHLIWNKMLIHTAFDNRLDARDKKTNDDIETILEMQHETTDEQAYPLWNGVKLYQGHRVINHPADVPGLITTQQPEGVAFDRELFFDAMQYYSNKEMLKQVCDRMQTIKMAHPTTPKQFGQWSIYREGGYHRSPSMCKFMNPYAFCGILFHVPQGSTEGQIIRTTDSTVVEHLTVQGHYRFLEFNPDFNFSRA